MKFLVTVIAAPRGCEGTVRDTVEVESYSYEQAQWDAIRKFREKHPRHDFATFETWESRIQPEESLEDFAMCEFARVMGG